MNRNYLEATNDPLVVPVKMLSDYHSFYNTVLMGSEVQWAGGILKRLNLPGDPNGLESVFTDPLGNEVSLTYFSNLCAKARENEFIGAQWKNQYGFNPDAVIAS